MEKYNPIIQRQTPNAIIIIGECFIVLLSPCFYISLRGEKMYSFLDRLINLALPRIRDFQGLDPQKFDKNGNYTFGVNDQLIFPEIDYESVDQSLGFNISINTSAKNAKEGLSLLKKMGLPFHN